MGEIGVDAMCTGSSGTTSSESIVVKELRESGEGGPWTGAVGDAGGGGEPGQDHWYDVADRVDAGPSEPYRATKLNAVLEGKEDDRRITTRCICQYADG